MAGFEVNQPCVGAALETAIGPEVVHRHLVDGRRIEGEVADKLADQRDAHGVPPVVVQFSGEGQVLEWCGQTEILVVHEKRGGARRRDHVAQSAVGVALLREGGTAVVGVAGVILGILHVRRGELALDVVEAVVSGRELRAPVLRDVDLRAALDREKIFVIAGKLLRLVRRKIQIRVEHRESAGHNRGNDDVLVVVGQADGRAVKPEVVVEDDRRGEERVVEAPEPEGHAGITQLTGPRHGGRRTDREHARVRSAAPEVVADVSAVQPNGVLAELAALAVVGQAEGLVGRDRGVVVAGGDTHAGAEVVTQLDTRAEAHEHAVTAAVLVGVPLRGKLGAVDLERRSGVDRIEIRKGPGVIVALGIQVRLVAEADLAFRLEAGQ